MKTLLRQYFLLSMSLLLLASCDVKNQISSNYDKQGGVQDFARSEIIDNGPAYADGTSELLVVVQLMNSDGSVIKLFRPTYDIISGTGVIVTACTTSNDHGISTCVLKSTVPGTKRIALTNIQIALEADVVFDPPQAGKPILGLASSSKKIEQSGYALSGTIGVIESDSVKKSGDYSLFGGVQGDFNSR